MQNLEGYDDEPEPDYHPVLDPALVEIVRRSVRKLSVEKKKKISNDELVKFIRQSVRSLFKGRKGDSDPRMVEFIRRLVLKVANGRGGGPARGPARGDPDDQKGDSIANPEEVDEEDDDTQKE
jgi:hypothetical protein